MRKAKAKIRTKQEQPKLYIGKTLEQELGEAFESGSPIDASSAASLFEEEGTNEFNVLPGTDVRQDKFDIMQEHINEAERVGAEARAKAAEDRQKEQTKGQNEQAS